MYNYYHQTSLSPLPGRRLSYHFISFHSCSSPTLIMTTIITTPPPYFSKKKPPSYIKSPPFFPFLKRQNKKKKEKNGLVMKKEKKKTHQGVYSFIYSFFFISFSPFRFLSHGVIHVIETILIIIKKIKNLHFILLCFIPTPPPPAPLRTLRGPCSVWWGSNLRAY